MQLGWLDFSDEDRKKTLDVLSLLTEQGAVDELGIGIIRDAFANKFFPGTSTVQTRAKYFFIVPYILNDVGKHMNDARKLMRGEGVSQIRRYVNEQERLCAERLISGGTSADGIIGKRSLSAAKPSWVSRTPMDIYWSGICKYGIFKKDMTVNEYIGYCLNSAKNIEALGKRNAIETENADRDDDDVFYSQNGVFWNLPPYAKDWQYKLTIELTETEAHHLRRQILKNVPDSLLSFILKYNIDLNGFNDFRSFAYMLEHKHSKNLPADMCRVIALACDFDRLIYMARVRYNVMLSDGKNAFANEEWARLKSKCSFEAGVDLNAVCTKFEVSNNATCYFLMKLQQSFLRKDIEAADSLIKRREEAIKGKSRAKLNRKDEYKPDEWVGGKHLNYRFFIARRIVNDIYAGERKREKYV